MRCLVIGGSGQDGVLLAAQLLAEGHRVITVSRRPVPLGDVDHRIADAADRTALAAIVADATPDEVYFLAAHHRSSQDASPPLDADVAGCLTVNAVAFGSLLELRPDSFLSKKLALTALAARNDPAVRVQVGSFDDAADWGSARDYVAAMRCILRADVARDYIVASGVLRTVREFAEVCFGSLGLDWTKHVVAAAADGRPRWRLRGDATKLMAHTDWRPAFDFPGMVLDLVTRTDRYERQRPAGFHSYL